MIKEEKKVFKPNATTSLLVQSSLKTIRKKSDILDLGCGTGYVGLTIAKNTKIKNNYFFSDLSNKAIKLCKTNAKKNGIKIHEKKTFKSRNFKNNFQNSQNESTKN